MSNETLSAIERFHIYDSEADLYWKAKEQGLGTRAEAHAYTREEAAEAMKGDLSAKYCVLEPVNAPPSHVAPLDMLLFCPRCQEQHIDAPEPEKGWTNPPHATHTCKNCGLNWRPSNGLTNGVAYIKAEEEKHVERMDATNPANHAPRANVAPLLVSRERMVEKIMADPDLECSTSTPPSSIGPTLCLSRSTPLIQRGAGEGEWYCGGCGANEKEPRCKVRKGCPPELREGQRESVEDVLSIVDTYGPWGMDINASYRYQIVLADEVARLRGLLAEARPYLDLMGEPVMTLTKCDAEELAKRIDSNGAARSAIAPTKEKP